MNLIYMNTCEFFSLIEVELLLSIYIIINAASDLMALMNRLWVSFSLGTRGLYMFQCLVKLAPPYISSNTRTLYFTFQCIHLVFIRVLFVGYINTDLLGYSKTCKKPQYFQVH